MKRILSMFFAFFILVSVCFADTTLEIENTKEIVNMTLEEAIQYALNNNFSIVDLENIADEQKDIFEDAYKDYCKWKNQLRTGGYAFDDENEYLACWGHLYELAKLNYDSFLSKKEGTKLQIEYSIKNMVYSIYELEDTISFLEKTIDKQEVDVKIANVKYSFNMITNNDFENTKAILESSKIQLESTKKTLDALKISLKQIMAFDIEKELIIKEPEYEVSELVIEDLEKTINESIDTNSFAISSKIDYKEKENKYILATKTSFLLRDDKRNAKEAFSDAEIRLNNDINSIKENLNVLYYQVKSKEAEIKLAKEEMDRNNIQFEQAKVKYDIGIISKQAYLEHELSFINSKNSYRKKVKEGILLKNRFNIAINVGDIIAK